MIAEGMTDRIKSEQEIHSGLKHHYILDVSITISIDCYKRAW